MAKMTPEQRTATANKAWATRRKNAELGRKNESTVENPPYVDLAAKRTAAAKKAWDTRRKNALANA